MDRKAHAAGDLPSKFFGSITNPINAETGLHEVFDKKAQVAVVDGCAMQCFGDRYPGRAKQLKTLVASEKFPLSVVAIREGAMDPLMLKRFTAGALQISQPAHHAATQVTPIAGRSYLVRKWCPFPCRA